MLINSKQPKIAIFRALQLGDLLCTVPAIRSLRQAFPQAKISLIGLPWARDFTRRFHHLIDNFIEFPGYPGLPEKAYKTEEILKFITQMQQENFDLIIQMHGNGTIVNPLIQTLGGKMEAGYWKEGNYCPNPQTFMLYPGSQNEIKKHLLLMQFLGIEPQSLGLEFPIFKEEEKEFARNIKKWNLQIGNYVVIHPGARFEDRRWRASKFAEVADYLAGLGYQVVLSGVDEEKEIIQEVFKVMVYSVLNLTGETDLGQIGLLIQNAAILISNDTGVSHLAAAFKTPSVIVSRLQESEFWEALNKNLHKVVQANETNDTSLVISQINSLLNIYPKTVEDNFQETVSL